MSSFRHRLHDWLTRVWYERRGAPWVLRPLELVYVAGVCARRRLHERGLFKATRLDVPVIVVGNISAGGTGKTPLVLWLVERLRQLGCRPGIVSRGYGGRGPWPATVTPESDPALVGDEPVMLSRRAGCAVVVGPDRVSAARQLVGMGVDIIVADDGLQHLPLARDLEIAVIDGRRGLGNGHCLPAGPLREPSRRLGEVDCRVITGADAIDGWDGLRMDLVPATVTPLGGNLPGTVDQFAGHTVHAVAGIGHPERFFQTLRRSGIGVIPHPLPDHAGPRELQKSFGDGLPVLITEKDAVKWRSDFPADTWVLRVDARFEPGAEKALLGMVRGVVA